MSILQSLFGGSSKSNNNSQLPWIQFTSESQVEEIIENSKFKTQLIFKHSTRCGISRMTLNQFQSIFLDSGLKADLYYLDLLSYRKLSNLIAEKFDIRHQSPQVIIIKNGVVVAHDSHGGITSLKFSQYT